MPNRWRNRASEGVDTGSKPRQLARHRVLVQHALGGRPVHFGLGHLEGGLRRRLVAGLDRGLHLLDESAHPAEPGTVDGRPFLGLSKPFLGRFVMRHLISSYTGGAGLYRRAGQASTAWSSPR